MRYRKEEKGLEKKRTYATLPWQSRATVRDERSRYVSPAILSVDYIRALYRFFSGTFVSLPGPIGYGLSSDTSTVGTRLGMATAFSGVGLLIGNPIAGAILKGRWSVGGAAGMRGDADFGRYWVYGRCKMDEIWEWSEGCSVSVWTLQTKML